MPGTPRCCVLSPFPQKKAAEAKSKSEVGEAERKRREKAEERAKNGPQDVTHTLAYWVLDVSVGLERTGEEGLGVG